MQPCLVNKAVPILLMFVKEARFLLAMSDEGLKKDGGQNTKIDEGRRRARGKVE